uniref:Uncharacterized protein n=1 Tax=Anguilla anguilla TaxID=7936 RepID=A0A0E9TXR2_ANGAN
MCFLQVIVASIYIPKIRI